MQKNLYIFAQQSCVCQGSFPSEVGNNSKHRLIPSVTPVLKFSSSTTPKIATIYLQSTRNNTICTLVDCNGNPVCWSSAGSIGFKNTRKSTTYASQAAAEKIAAKTLEKGFFSVNVMVKGLGYGKQSGVRALFKSGLRITRIEEITPVSYNGSRSPKKRRV